ncbi:uncharacterized protein [Macrobrachium rosenbergii]|uniref:uncharacterized protein n=1 Tax=Macrobrachium rosenbergii TaxID=79674 RepID=UPI0034D522A7
MPQNIWPYHQELPPRVPMAKKPGLAIPFCLYPVNQPNDYSHPKSDSAANGSPILTFSQKHLALNLGYRKYHWQFIITDASVPLLGEDFLAHHQLLVDISNRCLVDATILSTTPIAAAPTELTHHVTNSKDNFVYLLTTYPDDFKPELRQTPQIPVKHGIFHHIKTLGPSIHSGFWCLPPKKPLLQEHLHRDREDEFVSKCIQSLDISPSHSNSSSLGELVELWTGTRQAQV